MEQYGYKHELFQSTPSWRGRQFSKPSIGCSTAFQSTPSWRGRLFFLFFRYLCWWFQSTPSWRGRHILFLLVQIHRGISIHALVKRATNKLKKFSYVMFLFQSTPSWRGRLYYHHLYQNNPFQSTPSWRGRLRTLTSDNMNFSISIHALVKRATC